MYNKYLYTCPNNTKEIIVKVLTYYSTLFRILYCCKKFTLVLRGTALHLKCH